MAYDSLHMNRVFRTYAEFNADLQPIPREYSENEDDKGIQTMVSSLTGQEVARELLGPYYWVRNLVSSVLFSDAVKDMVAPGEAEESDDTVYLLIEVGPQSALGGAVEQILGYHGVKHIAFKSMPTRGRNALATSLELVSELASKLFLKGVPIDISQLNSHM
ncbi:unnamed protein product, partial [Penicillium glandicola]